MSNKKVALVIGNAAYIKGGVLRNPVNDANDIAEKLKLFGFNVIKKTDLTYRGHGSNSTKSYAKAIYII